jgi:hypothetical protein
MSRSLGAAIQCIGGGAILLVVGCSGAQHDPVATKSSRRVMTAAECRAIPTHGLEVAQVELTAALEHCPEPLRAQKLAALSSSIEEAKKAPSEGCKTDVELGKALSETELDCFMKGTRLDDWKRCGFSRGGGFVGIAEELDESVHKTLLGCEKANGETRP